MSAHYRLWYCDDLGNRITPISNVNGFEYAAVLGDMGVASFGWPRGGREYDLIAPDRRVHIYRRPSGGASALAFVALLNQFDIATSQAGQTATTSHGNDLTGLLERRITAEFSGEAETKITDYADDMMKAIVTNNFISNSDYSGTPDPTRSIAAYGYSVEGDLSAGPSLTKEFAWRNALTVLQDIQADAKAQGTEIFFGFIPTSGTAAEFRTWTQVRDRTISTGTNPILFSLESGNLANARLAYDHSREANYIYAGGKGLGKERVIQAASDSSRLQSSRLNRREAFAYSSGELAASVLADARNELERGRPRVTLMADLLDTPLTPYGGLRGWELGDKITASYSGIQFDATIRNVQVTVRRDGKEIIRSRIESD